MAGGFSWKNILEYVSSYNPLDAGVGSAGARFASTGFALSALLSGYSTAKYGYLGYLILFIQKQGMLGLRTSVIFANFQKGLGALFGVFLVYMAKFRMGLARMILYTYATFISGSQLLWVRPSKRSYRRLFLVAQLSMLGAAYSGERSASYVYKREVEKAVQRSRQTRRDRTPRRHRISPPPPTPPSPPPPPTPPSPPPSPCYGTRPGCTCYRPTTPPPSPPPPPPPPSPPPCYGARPGCTCYHPDNRLGGCIAPAATARESCVCSFWGEQYNWRPHMCPILKEGAQEGLGTCCYAELSCTEKENSGNSSVIHRTQKMVRNGPNSSVIHRVQKMVRNGPQDTEEERDSVSIQLEQENARKMRNRIRKKLFAAKLLGTILGTVLAAVFSTEVFIKISTAVAIISYNLFFWMGAQCYDLGEMENYDTTDEIENNSGEMEEHGKKNEDDGKNEEQIPDALVRELKKAAEVVLKLLPLWLTFSSTCYLVNATADSFFMDQVDYLENNTQSQSSKIPTSFFYSFPDIVSNITGQVSYYLVEQFHDEKKEGQDVPKRRKEAQWATLLRISIGMLFSSLCCMVASLVAYYRLDSNYNSASMLWLLPQFLLWGMMKGILEEGLEEILHDYLDDNLQVQAVCGIAEAVGNFLSMILTAASPSSWVGSGNDISKSHLDNYYRMLAIITLSSTFLFTIVAIAYEFWEKEDTEKSGKKG